jgi:pimeloyl-ACP methyl ester carboxylesterase
MASPSLYRSFGIEEEFKMTIQSLPVPGLAPEATVTASAASVHYRTIQVNGLDVFYREAGPDYAPALLLLHGFPTSSHMFRELIPRLADRYRVIAPDYPGFGYSAAPERAAFVYTFENLAQVIERFTQAIGLDRYGLYVMDYGAPVGYRLALGHPERVRSLIVQNGNAYEEGLGEFWAPIRKYWQDPSRQNRDALRVLLKPESTRWQYIYGVADTSLLSPDTWTLDQAGLDRPVTTRSSSTCSTITAPTCRYIHVSSSTSATTSRQPWSSGARMTPSFLPKRRCRSGVTCPTRRFTSSIQATSRSRRTATKSLI